jgi:hypothetical protein
MTTTMFSGTASHADDTTFRVNGKGVSDGLAAIGMVKTSDTGQINWASVTKPVAANGQAGYEIWRFNDTLQATAPLFVRIDYGVGSTVTFISHWITVGRGSNGAGAITGTIMASQQVAHTNGNASAYNWYLSSADGSTLVILAAPGTATAASRSAIVVERSRTAAGAATATGVLVVYGVATALVTTRAYNYATGGTVTVPSGFPAAVPTNGPMASGGAAPVFPGVVMDGALNVWQPRALVVGNATDMGALTSITIPTFGTYLPAAGFLGWDAGAVGTTISPAFAWS